MKLKLPVDGRWRRRCRVSAVSASFCALVDSLRARCHVDMQHDRKDESERMRGVGGATAPASAAGTMPGSEPRPRVLGLTSSITGQKDMNL